MFFKCNALACSINGEALTRGFLTLLEAAPGLVCEAFASSIGPATLFIWTSALYTGAFGFFPYAVELCIRPLLARIAVRIGALRRHTEAKLLIPSVTRFAFKHCFLGLGVGLGHGFGRARSLAIISIIPWRIDWLWSRFRRRLFDWIRCAICNTVTFLLAPPLAFFTALVPLGAPVVAHAVVDLRRVVVILATALITVF